MYHPIPDFQEIVPEMTTPESARETLPYHKIIYKKLDSIH